MSGRAVAVLLASRAEEARAVASALHAAGPAPEYMVWARNWRAVSFRPKQLHCCCWPCSRTGGRPTFQV